MGSTAYPVAMANIRETARAALQQDENGEGLTLATMSLALVYLEGLISGLACRVVSDDPAGAVLSPALPATTSKVLVV